MEKNYKYETLLCKINHKPLIISKIFEFSLERPFILFQMIDKSKYIKEMIKNVELSKNNTLSKQINMIYSLFFGTLNFEYFFKEIMTKKIIIEQEETNYYVTKPNLNILYDECLQQLFKEYSKFLPNKPNTFYVKHLIDYCMNKPKMSLSINLFTKENDNNFNFEFTESDLDINYLKYINIKENINKVKNQKYRLIINIYNRYYNNYITKNKKTDHFKNSIYTNIDIIKNLKTEEIYFIRPSLYEYNIEKIINQNGMIEELKTMFDLLKAIKYSDELTSICFSDNIIKNLTLLYKEICPFLKPSHSNNDNLFKNLKHLGINLNLINKKLKNDIDNFFHYNLIFIDYQDIINNQNIKNKFEGTLFINLEKNIIYNNKVYEYLSKLFNKNNAFNQNNITKLIISYEIDNTSIINNSYYNLYDTQKLNIKECFLPNLKEITINNITKKISNKKLIEPNKIFNILSFLCYNSHSLNSIILNDTFVPYNIFDIFQNKNKFINSITNLEINSASLQHYNYSTIIENINKCHNLEYITINTTSSNSNDSFENIKISKNLKNIKSFSFNNFFVYTNKDHKEIQFKQNSSIEKELIELFSEIIENEKNLDILRLNGFQYNFNELKNANLTSLYINLEKNDKDYKIKETNKKVSMKLNNFPKLIFIYIYVDIMYEIDDFIQLPTCKNLQRIFLFSSVIICDINYLDNILKKNGIELIVRNIKSFNKSKLLAHASS